MQTMKTHGTEGDRNDENLQWQGKRKAIPYQHQRTDGNGKLQGSRGDSQSRKKRTSTTPVDDVDTELLLRMIIIRFNGIHIVFMAEGRGRRFAKEGGRGRSQRETRDYDPKYTRQ